MSFQSDTQPIAKSLSAMEKKARRAVIRAARRALSMPERNQRANQLAEQVIAYLAATTTTAQRIGLYFSTVEEPDTTPTLQALHHAGHRVYLPVCEPGFALSWVQWCPGVQLVPSLLAPVSEPVGERHDVQLFSQVHTLIIPALSVDQSGKRLGQGGGYYDRFLPLLANYKTQVAAMVYDHEFVPAGSFQVDAHDQPVQVVFTPSAVHPIGR